MIHLDASRQRLLALAILLLLLAIGWLLIINPLLRHQQQTDSTIVSLQQQLERYEQINASLPALQQAHSELSDQLADADLLLDGRTAALQSAQLQQHIGAVISRYEAELVKVQSLPATSQPPLTAVHLSVELRLSLPQLTGVLASLQSDAPLLVISQLKIKAGKTLISRNTGKQVAWPLEVSFQVSGYSRQEQTP